MIKGILDIFGAVILLLLLSPFLLAVIILILIFERDHPFFLQERIGREKQPFTIIKLRTMKNGKITRLGSILRKTGIDELPQLLNIIKRDMSFVGPRPLTLVDVERLEWDTDFYQKRWSVRPGIVGLAQLSPVCHKKMSWFYDQLYLERQSLILDFKILMAAVMIPFTGKSFVKKRIHGKEKV
jgi:lipopolysaccharide/colanic/teichoic acid biosynthesis glycosyltransferase